MSAGGTALRRQIAELRALVAQAAALHAGASSRRRTRIRSPGPSGSSGLTPRSLAARRAPRRRCAPRHPVLPASGKSTIVALKAADLVRRGGMAVVVAPSLRQSSLLFRKLNRLLVAGGESFRRETADRTRDRPRRPCPLPARRPARHAARACRCAGRPPRSSSSTRRPGSARRCGRRSRRCWRRRRSRVRRSCRRRPARAANSTGP